MSQHAPDYLPAHETNGLGIAGFICSLVGILTGGILSPIGLILSLVALGKRPRGWAIAGTILGFVGSCGLIAILIGAVVLGLGALAALVGLVLLTDADRVEVTRDMATIAVMIDGHEKENRYLPASLEVLDLPLSTMTDPWGKRYAYHLTDDDTGFDLVSAGPDGSFGGEDDLAFSRLDEVWEQYGESPSISVTGRPEGGRMVVTVGGSTIELTGDEDGGAVNIETNGETILITGDASGGRINVTRTPHAPESDADEPGGDGDG
jgi:type II secretory pathway pseudopilin PulG